MYTFVELSAQIRDRCVELTESSGEVLVVSLLEKPPVQPFGDGVGVFVDHGGDVTHPESVTRVPPMITPAPGTFCNASTSSNGNREIRVSCSGRPAQRRESLDIIEPRQP